MTEHTLKAFSEELQSLVSDVSRMGGMAEQAVADAVASVLRRDEELARRVIERDVRIDDMQREIERKIMLLLALRQPMARDLRQTVSALKLAGDLERIGDLAKNVAKRGLRIQEGEPMTLVRGIERMGRLACDQLKQVLDAFAAGEATQAVAVWSQDEELDHHYNSLFRELVTYMMEDPRMIGSAAHLLFMAKNLERIGDHCTNMAEVVHFEVTGIEIGADRPKAEDGLPPVLHRSESTK